MIDKINDLLRRVEAFKPKVDSEIEEFRIRMLGRKGEMNDLFEEFKKVAPEMKKELGQKINALKTRINEKIAEMKAAAENAETTAQSQIDMTRPGSNDPIGSRHPISLVKNQIVEIFSRLGYTVAEGPEIESDLYNFQLLNVPKDHPARDMQDTFYVNDSFVLRTHTSPMQARMMTTRKPPIRVVIPGKVYRSDDDASHSPIFHQIEGLAVDKHITMGDLEGCLLAFAQQMFSKDTQIRLRPSYFPFTEPSVEVDVTCAICGGKGCRVCKGTGWVEILGAGVVNPAVLEMCGIDSKEYSGFAFGLGLERIAMIKYGIPNIKLFYENDVRFLKQFNGEVEK